jgi:hypothetical protein
MCEQCLKWLRDIHDYTDEETGKIVYQRRWIFIVSDSPVVHILLSITPLDCEPDEWESATRFMIGVNGCYGKDAFFEGTLDQAKEHAIKVLKPYLTQLQTSIDAILAG